MVAGEELVCEYDIFPSSSTSVSRSLPPKQNGSERSPGWPFVTDDHIDGIRGRVASCGGHQRVPARGQEPPELSVACARNRFFNSANSDLEERFSDDANQMLRAIVSGLFLTVAPGMGCPS